MHMYIRPDLLYLGSDLFRIPGMYFEVNDGLEMHVNGHAELNY